MRFHMANADVQANAHKSCKAEHWPRVRAMAEKTPKQLCAKSSNAPSRGEVARLRPIWATLWRAPTLSKSCSLASARSTYLCNDVPDAAALSCAMADHGILAHGPAMRGRRRWPAVACMGMRVTPAAGSYYLVSRSVCMRDRMACQREPRPGRAERMRNVCLHFTLFQGSVRPAGRVRYPSESAGRTANCGVERKR